MTNSILIKMNKNLMKIVKDSKNTIIKILLKKTTNC